MKNKPNPRLQPRKQIRLRGYDYSFDGSYFVTIDCQHKECHFGHVHRGKMILNDFGKIAEEEWLKLPLRFPHVTIGIFQIMPNHMHAIIELKNNCVQVGLAPTDCKKQGDDEKSSTGHNKSLSDILGSYKSLVANHCLKCHQEKYLSTSHTPILGKIWKRSFYDHIIRDETSLKSVSRYIKDNPAKWGR